MQLRVLRAASGSGARSSGTTARRDVAVVELDAVRVELVGLEPHRLAQRPPLLLGLVAGVLAGVHVGAHRRRVVGAAHPERVEDATRLADGLVRAVDDLAPDRRALGGVGVEQRRARVAAQHQRELPREVERVLDRGVRARARSTAGGGAPRRRRRTPGRSRSARRPCGSPSTRSCRRSRRRGPRRRRAGAPGPACTPRRGPAARRRRRSPRSSATRSRAGPSAPRPCRCRRRRTRAAAPSRGRSGGARPTARGRRGRRC